MNLKELVKDNKVYFYLLRAGIVYYKVQYQNEFYSFPVRLDDIGEATLLSEDKAIIFMRYIRKAIENNEIHKI